MFLCVFGPIDCLLSLHVVKLMADIYKNDRNKCHLHELVSKTISTVPFNLIHALDSKYSNVRKQFYQIRFSKSLELVVSQTTIQILIKLMVFCYMF